MDKDPEIGVSWGHFGGILRTPETDHSGGKNPQTKPNQKQIKTELKQNRPGQNYPQRHPCFPVINQMKHTYIVNYLSTMHKHITLIYIYFTLTNSMVTTIKCNWLVMT